jgi:hypothetical protein
MKLLAVCFLLCLPLTITGTASGDLPQANLLANPSFEAGVDSPTGWTAFSLGGAAWERKAADGTRSVSVTGLGDDVSWWSPTTPPALQPNRVYRLSYWLRQEADATGGTPLAGSDWVNRDTPAGTDWSERAFCFRTPDVPMSRSLFRLGEWHVKGKVFFDAVTLTPAMPLYSRQSEALFELGEGETVAAGRYTASHSLGGYGSTDFRCLERFTARFNSDRWVFSGPSEVVYRHSLGRTRQTDPEVELNVNYWVSGSVVVEVSADGKQWAKVGEAGKIGGAAFPVPSDLVPAKEMWVKLSGGEGADLQVNSYTYRCRLPDTDPELSLTGSTSYLAATKQDADLDVAVESIGDLRPGGRNVAELVITNRGPRRLLNVTTSLGPKARVVYATAERIPFAPGQTRRVSAEYELRASGRHVLTIRCIDVATDQPIWEGQIGFTVAPLYDADGGWLVAERKELRVWWCEPERKVGRDRPAPQVPSRAADAIRIEAAANEYEAAQVVLHPPRGLRSVRITATDLRADSGAIIPAADIEIRQVGYVHVSQPTDELGVVDDWPDPLPLHNAPVDIAKGRNHPFWVTVYVPPGTPKGVYRGELRVASDGPTATVPLEVRVWGFELPRETHLRSGFGLSQGEIRRYHNLETEEEVRQVYRLYQRSFAQHRVAPYSVGRPIRLEWETGPGEGLFPKLDFTEFDEDARFALDELGFNSFVIHLEGLGGGTFQSRRPGQIGPYEQGTREYELSFARGARAIQDHLEERGWLGKAYVYWFDEPEQKDHDFVREGMELIHRAAPKLTRLLTTHPTAKLYGAVDLWCLPTYTLKPEEIRPRRLAGEEIWWYLCTGPKAPYFTLFLDHYGTEIRLWSWETWKYGLDGLLVWETTYWTSEQAYPDSLQDPWQDAMSWQSSYGLQAGEKAPWGNGDGRFLYPPKRDPGTGTTKYLGGPIPSIRWELLRDGIEDYEYLWLLKQEIARLKQAGASPDACREAETLLEVPPDICTSLTEFATTPEPIHTHRAKVAEAIERLREQ